MMRALLTMSILLSVACGGTIDTVETSTVAPAGSKTVTPSESATTTGRSPGRVGAPDWLPCDRSDVNGYMGQVVRYTRSDREIAIEIHTDWDTTENVTLRFQPGEAESHLRLVAEPFRASDWPRIESAPGAILPGTRVQAWVCNTPGNPTILDFRPAE